MSTCSLCGKETKALQGDLFSTQQLCIQCLTNERAKMMLNTLPDPGEWEWEKLSKWEQGFLHSVRQQFEKKGSLSEAQYQSVERIWEKVNK